MKIRLLKLTFDDGSNAWECLRDLGDGRKTSYRVDPASQQPSQDGEIWLVNASSKVQFEDREIRIVAVDLLEQLPIKNLCFDWNDQWQQWERTLDLPFGDEKVRVVIVVDKFDKVQPTSHHQNFRCEGTKLVTHDQNTNYFVLAVHIIDEIGKKAPAQKKPAPTNKPIVPQLAAMVAAQAEDRPAVIGQIGGNLPTVSDEADAELQAIEMISEDQQRADQELAIRNAMPQTGKGIRRLPKPNKRNQKKREHSHAQD